MVDQRFPAQEAFAASATTTWTGSGDGSSWGNANNWNNGVPDASKDAVINLASIVSVTTTSATITFDSLIIGGSSASNTITLTGSISGNNITIDNNGTFVQSNSSTQTISGALTVKSGAFLTHTTNTTAQAFSVNIAATDIDIQSGGRVNVDGLGYRGSITSGSGQGPGGGVGTGASGAGGGANGGNGAKGVTNNGGTSYCSPAVVPIIGSGGGADSSADSGGNAGGLIRLSATSTLTINGTISAKGKAKGSTDTPNVFNGGGSGGGIRLSANTISGTPLVFSAKGGVGGTSSGGGGGGCVQIIYTTSNSLLSTGISVVGGNGSSNTRNGGTGQVFIQKVGNNGDLYLLGSGVANAGASQIANAITMDSVTVSGSSTYGIPTGGTLTLAGGTPLLGDQSGVITATGTIALNATNTISNVSLAIASGGVFTNSAAVVNIASGVGLTIGPGSTVTNAITDIFTSGTLIIYQSATHRISQTANVTVGSGTTTVFGFVTTTAPLTLGTLTIQNGGYVTHGPNVTAQSNIINLAANTITVQSGGVIIVDGKGYRGGLSNSSGAGPGAGVGTGGSGAGGGAYGGNGAKGTTNIGGTAYCDPTNVSFMGSGGGTDVNQNGGGNGGGLIRLSVTSTLTINGTISAKGTSETDRETTHVFNAGGSGGGISIIADTIAGTPTSFNAGGGGGGTSGGGGGGGCVGITYTSANSLNPLTMISATGGSGVRSGGAGVVFVKHVGSNGDLYVIGSGSADPGSGQSAVSITADTATVTGTAAYGIPSGGALSLASATPLVGNQTGTITATGTLALSATNTISNISIAMASGSVLTMGATVNVANGISFTLGSGSTLTTPITELNTSGTVTIFRTTTPNLSSSANLTISLATTTFSGFSTTTPLTLGDVTIKNTARLTHGANFDTQTHTLNIAANNITIQSGGGIVVDGRGYQGGVGSGHYAGYGPGAGGGNNNSGAGGGGHGGNGGAGVSWAGGTAYCSSTNPVTIGSGGGSDQISQFGGNGGGLIQLSVTSTLTINGIISARGRSELDTFTNAQFNGGGAGGGVKIIAATIAGTPTLFSATGGPGGTSSGGGGGGCVAITYTSITGTATSSVSVAGGSGGNASGLIGTTNFSSNAPANTAPTASTPTPVQSSASLVTVTSTIADADLNTTSLGVQYSTDNSSWVNATIDTGSENGEGNGVTTSTGRISGIDTNNDGSVALTFTWNAANDLPNTEDPTVFLRITPNDGTASGTTMTSSAFALDTKAPTAPGALTVNTTSTRSVTFNFGAATTDQSFREYIIYYKTGSSGVTTSDSAYTSSSDPHLGSISYSGFSTVTLSNLLVTSTQYVANIWAFDAFSQSTPSASEVTFYTLADTPGTPTVTASSSATILHLTIDPATNPSGVTYDICRTTNGTSCAAGSSYVQADGSLNTAAVFQTYTAWGGATGLEITGLTPNTGYRFLVQAKNGDGFATNFSTANATVTTSNVGVTLSKTTAAATEGGATDSYTVVLASKPSSDVTVMITGDSSVSASPSPLTFTTGNWSTPQTVTVTAVNDSIAQGTHTGTITHAVTSADTTYNALAVSDVTATITDNDTAGVNVSTISVATTEGGATGSYTIVLNSQPTSTVTVVVSPDANSTVSTSSIAFTSSNWNVAVTVTVTAVNDSVAQGTHASTITHSVSSASTGYQGTAVSSVTNTITDNDTAGVSLSKTTAATTEGGTTDSYTVVLNSQPTSTVTVVVSPDSGSTVSTSSIAFTSSNWNSAVTVTVTAVDDSIAQGTHSSTITHSASSQSTGYNASTGISSVTNTITDNDTAGVGLSKTAVTTTEGGTTDSYTIVLNTQPTSTVTVVVSPDSGSTVSTSSIAFTSANWDIAITVTVSAVNDLIAQGTHVSTISHSITSQSTGYDNAAISSVTNTITDNDTTGVIVSKTGVATTEGGATDSYTIVLASSPTSTVQILVSSDSAQTVSTSTIAFTSSDWNIPVTVTVTPLDDSTVNGTHTGTITHTASSACTGYNASTAIASVTDTITDNDVAPVVDQGGGGVGSAGSPSLPPLVTTPQIYDSVTGLYITQLPTTVLPNPLPVPSPTPMISPPQPPPPLVQMFFFTRTLSLGSTGEDVRQLQIYLNAHGFPVDGTGAGSAGQETTTFGLATRSALIRFQQAHLRELFGPTGTLSQSNGIFGPLTRAFVNENLTPRLNGRILIQVQQHGEAWYVYPVTGLRYYLKDGLAAYDIMRRFALGITDQDLATIPSVQTVDQLKSVPSVCSTNRAANAVKGRILLQVQQHGEAWYVDVSTCRRIYMKDGARAYLIMQFLGLGITDADLAKIPVGA